MKVIIEPKITQVDVTYVKPHTIIMADFDVQHSAIEKTLLDAKGDIVAASAADTPVRVPVGSAGQALVADSTQAAGVKWKTVGGDVACQVLIDGGGNAITTGVKLDVIVPFNVTLKQHIMIAGTSGSIVLDLWKCTYAQYDDGTTHPVVGDSICASAKPTISSAVKAKDSTLTGWTKSWAKEDVVRINVDSCTSTKRLAIMLIFERV